MKLKINTKKFLDLLTKVSGAVAVKTPMPILSGVLLSAYDKTISLTASNTEISIKALTTDDSILIDEEGSIVTNAKMLIEIVKRTKASTISLESKDNNLFFRTQSGEYKLVTMEASDYPNVEFESNGNVFTMPYNTFNTLSNETLFATSTNDKKPILTGVNLKHENNQLVATATDSFRLAKKNIELTFDKEINITIPKKALVEMNKLFAKSENLDFNVNKSKLLVCDTKNDETIYFATNLLDGTYPDTSKLIPDSFPITVKLNRLNLIDTIERIALLSISNDDDSHSLIELAFKDNLTISSFNSRLGSGKEDMSIIEKNGADITLACSGTYMLDALNSISTENVYINITSDIRPFIIKGEEQDNIIQLILPIRS